MREEPGAKYRLRWHGHGISACRTAAKTKSVPVCPLANQTGNFQLEAIRVRHNPLDVEKLTAPCSSSTPANDPREICWEFQGTIADFFVTDQEVTKEIQHASVYDAVYGAGPDTIMKDFYGARIQKPPSFRGMHIAVNCRWPSLKIS
ncbi:hypothetical protein BCR34DRAFT_582704 [Clohesyomyces aquaticus]|uniref:Uncharacterized protein n=1 Tax=Clohesyomyces aquaticus TaxID=1231657 RepID=A0A1Y2A8X9_9PLEO|nr:hypothetical protein BCR34DRAFT_582704 [Clohesyomyces aquaticus]